MNWFINLKTSNKLFVGFGLIVALLVVTIGTAYYGMAELQNRFRIVKITDELESNSNEQRARMLTMLLTTNSPAVDALYQEMKKASLETDELLPKLRELVQGNPVLIATIEEYVSIRSADK